MSNSTAFVLGNGISRKGIILSHLKAYGKVYGCNALHREFEPDVLVATDRPIATHIQDIGYAAKHKFYTRKPIEGNGALRVPQEYYGYSSGPIATGLAAIDKHRRIYLVGFDMGPSVTKGFNNVYADTEFYRASSATPTFTGNWIRQLCKVMNDYPLIQFYRVAGPTTVRISELDKLKNLAYIDIEAFTDSINNQKDLGL